MADNTLISKLHDKFGIVVNPIDESSLDGKYVIIKESMSMKMSSTVTVNSSYRKVTRDLGDNVETVALNENRTEGRWDKTAFDGWLSNEDAEKILLWKILENDFV